MERRGFIRDMRDVKVLVLYVCAKVNIPVTAQEIYEIGYQDEKLSYFDLHEAVAFLERTGHLDMVEEVKDPDTGKKFWAKVEKDADSPEERTKAEAKTDEKYVITEKGRENGGIMENLLPYTLRRDVAEAADEFNRESRRKEFVKTEMYEKEEGVYVARLILDDIQGRLMTLELTAPNQPQAAALCRYFQKNAESVYNLLLVDIFGEYEE